MRLRPPNLKRWLPPNAFEELGDRPSPRVMRWLVGVSWIVYVLVIAVSWHYRDWRTMVAMGSAIVLQMVPLCLVSAGRLRAAAFVFTVIVLGAVTSMATFGQGARDIGLVAYPIILVFAGLTLSRSLFFLSVVLMFAAASWLALGEAAGLFTTKPLVVSNPVYLLGLLAVLLVGALAVYALATSVRSSLSLARRELRQREQAEQALRASEAQLRQSQKMEAVGQLAGGIAHDFNNLLTAILGYTDLLLSDPGISNPSSRKDLEEVRHSADRATALTRQMLAFSRRQVFRSAIVSLNDVLDGLETLLRRSLGEDIELVYSKDPRLGLVDADVHQFEQVIMNLVVNARNAMPTGGRLLIETGNVELDEAFCREHSGASPGSHVWLRVSDTGMGMDEAIRLRIFEPFFTTKAPGDGTGLGLAVVYGIVKQSNGSIFVESEPGSGAAFTIYLPRVTAAGPIAPRPEIRVSNTRGAESILLVEDETAVRKLTARVLGDLGYDVVAVDSVAEALELAARPDLSLDLLLTDVVLPGEMQGNDLARALLVERPGLQVIYVSGYSRDALVHAGRLDQGLNLLEKPFTPEALAKTVRAVLEEGRPSTGLDG